MRTEDTSVETPRLKCLRDVEGIFALLFIYFKEQGLCQTLEGIE